MHTVHVHGESTVAYCGRLKGHHIDLLGMTSPATNHQVWITRAGFPSVDSIKLHVAGTLITTVYWVFPYCVQWELSVSGLPWLCVLLCVMLISCSLYMFIVCTSSAGFERFVKCVGDHFYLFQWYNILGFLSPNLWRQFCAEIELELFLVYWLWIDCQVREVFWIPSFQFPSHFTPCKFSRRHSFLEELKDFLLLSNCFNIQCGGR